VSLFTFGCSFTRYSWPTWADIVGREFEVHENWGQVGGGNQFIFNSLIECIVKNKITKDDVVIIMWTNISREDRYVKNKWVLPGNIFTQSTYSQDFVKEFADIRGYFIQDLNTIFATQNILENLGCKFYFLSMVPLSNAYQYYYEDNDTLIQDLHDSFKFVLDSIRSSIYEVVFNFDWTSRPFTVDNKITERGLHYNRIRASNWPIWDDQDETTFIANLSNEIKRECFEIFQLDFYHNNKPIFKRIDMHPTPLEHLEYIEKVLPEILISRTTSDWALSMDTDVKLNRCNWNPRSPTRW